MKNILMSMVVGFALCGCTKFTGGAAVGAGGAAAGYEINARNQMDQLEKDYKAGRISKQEYEIRKDQIKKDSALQ